GNNIVEDLAKRVEGNAVARVVLRNGIFYPGVLGAAYLNGVVSVVMAINVVNDNVFCLVGINSITTETARCVCAGNLKVLNNDITGLIYFNPRPGGSRDNLRSALTLIINDPHQLQ